jgi:hypothetical protein
MKIILAFLILPIGRLKLGAKFLRATFTSNKIVKYTSSLQKLLNFL